jgi:hypothetical protein
MLAAFFETGDYQTAIPLLNETVEDSPAMVGEIRFLEEIEAMVSLRNCYIYDAEQIACDIAYSNAFYEAVGAKPDLGSVARNEHAS